MILKPQIQEKLIYRIVSYFTWEDDGHMSSWKDGGQESSTWVEADFDSVDVVNELLVNVVP